MGISLGDVLIDGSDYEISLTKLVGKHIKDIGGYISQCVDGDLVFKLTELTFEDDTKLWFEGEHDFPYLDELNRCPQPNFNIETFETLYAEEE